MGRKGLLIKQFLNNAFVTRGIDDMCQMFILKTNFQVR